MMEGINLIYFKLIKDSVIKIVAYEWLNDIWMPLDYLLSLICDCDALRNEMLLVIWYVELNRDNVVIYDELLCKVTSSI